MSLLQAVTFRPVEDQEVRCFVCGESNDLLGAKMHEDVVGACSTHEPNLRTLYSITQCVGSVTPKLVDLCKTRAFSDVANPDTSKTTQQLQQQVRSLQDELAQARTNQIDIPRLKMVWQKSAELKRNVICALAESYELHRMYERYHLEMPQGLSEQELAVHFLDLLKDVELKQSYLEELNGLVNDVTYFKRDKISVRHHLDLLYVDAQSFRPTVALQGGGWQPKEGFEGRIIQQIAREPLVFLSLLFIEDSHYLQLKEQIQKLPGEEAAKAIVSRVKDLKVPEEQVKNALKCIYADLACFGYERNK